MLCSTFLWGDRGASIENYMKQFCLSGNYNTESNVYFKPYQGSNMVISDVFIDNGVKTCADVI